MGRFRFVRVPAILLATFSAWSVSTVPALAVSDDSAANQPAYKLARSTYVLHAYHAPGKGWIIVLENTREEFHPVHGAQGLVETTLSGIMVNDSGYDSSGFMNELTTQTAWALGNRDGLFHGRIEEFLLHFEDGTYQVWGESDIRAFENGDFVTEEQSGKGQEYALRPVYRKLPHKYVFFPYSIAQIRDIINLGENRRIYANDSSATYVVESEDESLYIRGDSDKVRTTLLGIGAALHIPMDMRDGSSVVWVQDIFGQIERFAFNDVGARSKDHVLFTGRSNHSDIWIYVDNIKTEDYAPAIIQGTCDDATAQSLAPFKSQVQESGSPRWETTVPLAGSAVVDNGFAVLVRAKSDGRVRWCSLLDMRNALHWDD